MDLLDYIGRPDPVVLYAACRGVDPELFFPERGEPGREAKAVCDGCVVKAACLEYALEHEERHGIWGGLSERERRRYRRQQRMTAEVWEAAKAEATVSRCS